MPSALYLGFGEFGRKLAITFTRMYIQEKDLGSETSIVRPLICYDFYPGVHFDRDLKRYGLTPLSDDNVLLPEATRISIPEYKQLPSPAGIVLDAGVGSFWPLAAESVLANIGKSLKSFESDEIVDPLRLKEVEQHRKSYGHNVFIFSASSSGGTGNGSCPEFTRFYLSFLNKQGIAPPRILPIAVTVLPFKNDPRLRIAEPNALTFLGRIVASGVKTVFLADNEHFYRKGLGTEAAEAKVNELLAYSLASLLLMDYAMARRWEAADYVNFFAVPGRASITVPSFARISPESFAPRTLDLRRYVPGMLYFKIKEGIAADVDFEKRPPERALLLVILPKNMQLQASVLGDIENELNTLITRDFHVRQANVTIITGAPITDVWVSAYFVEPYIHRIKEIYNRASKFLSDSQAVTEHIRRMIETMGGSIYESEEGKFIGWIKSAYELFIRYFDLYVSGSTSPGNPSFFPYTIMKIPTTSVPLREEKILKVNICYLPANVLKSEEDFIVYIYSRNMPKPEKRFNVREYTDRKISEMIIGILKILSEFQELETKNPEVYRVTIDVGGREIPIPPEALQYCVAELPKESELTIYLAEAQKGKARREKRDEN